MGYGVIFILSLCASATIDVIGSQHKRHLRTLHGQHMFYA